MKETSSSSGSARLRQEASHNGPFKMWGFRESIGNLTLKEDPDLVVSLQRAIVIQHLQASSLSYAARAVMVDTFKCEHGQEG